MNALVISGGGSKGAFGGGMAQYLLEQKEYDIFVGSSTGSLLIPLMAAGRINKIKSVYTTIKPKDIFSKTPYKLFKRHNVYYSKIDFVNVIRSLFHNKTSSGESNNLLETIRSNFTEIDYERIKSTGKKVIVTVTNMSTMEPEYKSIYDYSYDEFCEWIWISANYLPLMSLVVKNHMSYGDGSITNNIPIEAAFKYGATEMDVIIHYSKKWKFNTLPSRNVLEIINKLFTIFLKNSSEFRYQVALNTLKTVTVPAVKVNSYYLPKFLTDNSLLFASEKMKIWWEEGYKYIQKVINNSNNEGDDINDEPELNYNISA